MIIHSIKLWQHKTILILKYICSQKYHQIKITFWCTVFLLWLTDCQDSSNISMSIIKRFTDRNVFCWWEIASLSLQKIADVIINDTLHWFLGPWGIVCNTINIRIQIINSPKVVVYFSKKKNIPSMCMNINYVIVQCEPIQNITFEDFHFNLCIGKLHFLRCNKPIFFSTTTGTDKRFCNCIGWCSRVLPCIKCDSVCGQRRKCPSFDKALSSDNVEKHTGYQKFTWDSKWSRKYFWLYAGT